ncbi:MAG: transposase [Hydrogenothermaceae bacterium]
MKRCKKEKGPLYKGNNGIREWFGFKFCLITDENGLPLFIGILPGSKHDINFLKDLLNNNTMLEYLRNSVITGDKAFNSKELVEQFKNLDISLEPIKKGKARNKQKERQSFLKRIRKRIETAFSKLY